MALEDLGVLMQEQPIELVERGYQPFGIGGIGWRRRSRASRSNVLIADALAAD
jgi:hypothetical protein